jgi:ABC-2 type transport system ATP-binding protein
VRSGRLDDLRHLMRTTVKVRTRGGPDQLRSAPFVHDLSEQGGTATFSVDRADLDRAMDLLTSLGIEELSVFPASLEDLFLREYQGASR